MKHILYIIAIFVVIGASYWYITKQNNNLLSLQEDTKYYKTKYNEQVAERQSQTANIKKLVKSNDSLKEVINNFEPKVYVKYKTVTVYDTIIGKIDSTGNFKKNLKTIKFTGFVKNNNLHIHGLKIYNDVKLFWGYETNIFKDNRVLVKVVNSSENLHIRGLESYHDIPKKWHEKWYITIPAAFAGGAIIGKL